MKLFLKPILVLGISMAFFACNSGSENKDDASAMPADSSSASTATTTTPAPAAFTPFDVAEITHTVKDYAKWRPAFNADSVNRKANGLEDIVVGRNMDDPNKILIALKVSDTAKAMAFAADPKLKEAMDKAGVISKPVFELFHVIRYNPDSKEKQWVTVTHKVKDFDTWLKVFDAEGTATRATYGLIDVVLARGIQDSNLVHIVFDVKDMAKAKARINDPALKKSMTDGGVISVPKIEFYNSTE
ncbi:MAG TPA: hypothetical protein VIJ92_13140 [Ginsengibacter sp.]